MNLQRELTHDVQTLEHSELDRLLHRECQPRKSHAGEVIRTPDHLIPDRWQIIDYIVGKYGHCPPPDIDIVYGSAFFSMRVPTSNKLYVRCMFYDCDLQPSNGCLELIDNLIEGGSMWQELCQVRSGTAKGNVVI